MEMTLLCTQLSTESKHMKHWGCPWLCLFSINPVSKGQQIPSTAASPHSRTDHSHAIVPPLLSRCLPVAWTSAVDSWPASSPAPLHLGHLSSTWHVTLMLKVPQYIPTACHVRSKMARTASKPSLVQSLPSSPSLFWPPLFPGQTPHSQLRHQHFSLP